MQNKWSLSLIFLVLLWALACDNAGYSGPDGDTSDDDPPTDGDTDGDTEEAETPDGDLEGEEEEESEEESETPSGGHLEQIQQDFDAYVGTPILLRGRVADQRGPVVGARVEIGETETQTDDDGLFHVDALPRFNRLLSIQADGYRPELILVHLCRPLTEDEIDLGTIILHDATEDRVRFLFGGDVSFGRRFLDTKDKTPRSHPYPDDPEALILASDPLPGTRDVVRFLAPFFHQVDYPVVNFESVVTTEPATPHEHKAYVYYTLPPSLKVLTELGVSYVSLGNNHVYDYLEVGLADTLRHLEEAGLAHSGAAANQADAVKPFLTELAGHTYAFLSMTSVSGSEHSINYVAGDDKGGAADLRDFPRVHDQIAAARQEGQVPIAQLHVGKEYTLEPTGNSHSYMRRTATAGAALVVCHHPHVAQGVEWIDGVLVIHNLGNLFFDQQRHETFLGMMMQVDMEGDRVTDARGYPIYLEDYRPRPIGGELADVLLRRLAEHGGEGAAYPYQGRLVVPVADQATATVDTRVRLDVTISDTGFAVADLRSLAPEGASLQRIEAASAVVSFRAGRDILLYGSFEDDDVDSDFLETERWDTQDGVRMTCVDGARRGVAALCILRNADNKQDAVVPFKNRVRVLGDPLNDPNKDLTLHGYARGDNAGRGQVVVRYYASEKMMVFDEQIAYASTLARFDWTPFSFDLDMPEDMTDDPHLGAIFNPRALRMFLRHSPPAKGEGLLAFDDLAVITWDRDLALGEELRTPHARDFVRVEGEPGTVTLDLVFRHYRPEP